MSIPPSFKYTPRKTNNSQDDANANVPLTERMRNLVKIDSLLAQNHGYRKGNGDYIQAKVMSATGITTFQRRQEEGGPPCSPTKVCHFTLADDTGIIPGIIYFKNYYDDLDSENVCQLLKKDKVCKITGFDLLDSSYSPDYPGLSETPYPLNIPRKVKLSNSTLNIEPVKEPVYAQIPYNFKKFEDVDNVAEGEFIDLIGFVERVSEVQIGNGKEYQWVYLRSSFDKENSFRRKVTLWKEGGHFGKVAAGGVYAFSKIKVKYYGSNKSLQTHYSSMMMEITDFSNLMPSQYHAILPLLHQQSIPSPLSSAAGRGVDVNGTNGGAAETWTTPRKRARRSDGEVNGTNQEATSPLIRNGSDAREAEEANGSEPSTPETLNGRARTSSEHRYF